MILDSSAVVAVLLKEAENDHLLAAITAADVIGVGSPTLVEAGIVLAARMGPAGPTTLQSFLIEADASVIEFREPHWRVATQAFLRYGKGRHPARLNLGDCFSYATARVAGRPLLCVGDDFGQTDLDLVPLGPA